MRIAFTMDDLPLWPQSYPPPGYSVEGIVKSIRQALRENMITGVYSFSNSWPLAKHPELSNLHDLRTRTSGYHDFAQFHVDLPGSMTVNDAHDIIERVEEDLRSQFPDLELLIHIDPLGHVDEPDNPLVETNEFAHLKDTE